MSDWYQRIGEALVGFVGEPAERILLYAEVEEGALSADVFIEPLAGADIAYRFAPDEVTTLVYAFWETGEGPVPPQGWLAMRYLVEGGRFTVELTYPDQVQADEALSDRRPRVLAAVFGERHVDYSDPRGTGGV